MEPRPVVEGAGHLGIPKERQESLATCRRLLAGEGFTVSLADPTAKGRVGGPPDLIASHGSRTIRVFVLGAQEVNAPETRVRVKAALREGEIRIYVRWPFRWRVLSNLERWRISGAPVTGF